MSRKRATTPDLPQWEDICIMVPLASTLPPQRLPIVTK